MKLLRYINIAFIAMVTLTVASCTKKADVDLTEAKLPAIQLSSLGYQQSSPFTTTTILQLQFGATTTGVTPGKFTVEILNGTTATSAVLKTVTFNSWSGNDATSTATTTNHTISYTLQPTTYNNTQVYSGLINLKLSLLGLSAATTYSVRATAYNSDGTKTSAVTQLSFFKTS